MTIVETPSRRELQARREGLLRQLGMSRDELRVAAQHGALVGEQWSLWGDVQDLDFLLGEDLDEE